MTSTMKAHSKKKLKPAGDLKGNWPIKFSNWRKCVFPWLNKLMPCGSMYSKDHSTWMSFTGLAQASMGDCLLLLV